MHEAKITINTLANNDPINVIMAFGNTLLYLSKIYYGPMALNSLGMTIGMCENDFQFWFGGGIKWVVCFTHWHFEKLHTWFTLLKAYDLREKMGGDRVQTELSSCDEF